MQKLIEQADPSRQLFETVNFAFMKVFHFLVKIAIFRVFLLFLGDLGHALHCKYLQPIYSHWLCYISHCNLAVIITAKGCIHDTQWH